MKKYLLIGLFLALTNVQSFESFGWGPRGHAIVAEIGYSMMDSAAKAAVKKYLSGMTLADDGNWMDVIKSDRKYDFMKPWHYTDFDKGSQYEPKEDIDIVQALKNAMEKLSHRDNLNKLDIKKNMLIIFHLCGDFHQPLHIGYSQDRGGNNVQVSYLGEETNLHVVWDSKIIEGENISKDDCMDRLVDFNKEMVDSYKDLDIEKWVLEPRQLLSGVYNFENGKIDRKYVDKNKKVIERQLLIAGIRLAAVMNSLFKA